MDKAVKNVRSPLFAGIEPGDMEGMLGCIGYHVRSYQKGEIIAFEEENINHVGVVLEGTVDMIKEDVWGNRTMLLRTYPEDVFGETFACGEDSLSVVSFTASRDCRVLFLSFCRVMHTCTHACVFHQTLIENMVRLIARKNRELMRKVEVVSKKTLREKIMAYLSIQAQSQGKKQFEIPLGRVEWAEYLCADRSALTRELAKMQEEGLIDYQRNLFKIL
ncbi:MAG: Crp/Fnr family transcriptional regulator [Oscillospiraceae bacterium]|nr:Crp/Fnr family transcriptional regulator [Oscillospiraceae bacterium]